MSELCEPIAGAGGRRADAGADRVCRVAGEVASADGAGEGVCARSDSDRPIRATTMAAVETGRQARIAVYWAEFIADQAQTCYEDVSRSSVQGDLVTESFKSLDEHARQLVGSETGEMRGTQVGILGTIADDVVRGDEQAVGDGNNRPLPPAPGRQPAKNCAAG